MATTKYLTEAGVRRLWAAIEAKFVDNDEIATMLSEIEPDTVMEALTNEEIDAITGYIEPVAPSDDPKEP